MNRLGFGYDAVRAINPRLIYCSISGYGQSGPRAGEAGHDLNYIGNTGLLSLQPGPADRPVVPPALVADIGGGTFPAVINILLALRQRDQTGKGCHLDIAMTDAMFTFAWHALAEGFATGRYPENGSSKLAGGSPRYQLYPHAGRQVRCLRRAGGPFLGAFTAAIGLDPSLQDDGKDPAATQRGGRQHHRRQNRRGMAPGSRRGRLLRHGSLRRWKKPRAIRISSGGACFRRKSRRPRARPFRPCRCRSRRNSASPGSKAGLPARRALAECLAAHQPRLAVAGSTPSRMTARRNGPIRFIR